MIVTLIAIFLRVKSSLFGSMAFELYTGSCAPEVSVFELPESCPHSEDSA